MTKHSNKSNSLSKSNFPSPSSAIVKFSATLHPIPLKVIMPESPTHLTPRRSPRFTPVVDRKAAGKVSKTMPLLHASGLRRSPRISSDNAGVQISLENVPLTKKSAEKSFLRRSPRFCAAVGIIGSQSHAVKPNYDIIEWQRCRGQDLQWKNGSEELKTNANGENFLRRSLRLTSTQSEGEKLCPNMSSKKLLKSPATDKRSLEDVSSNKSSFQLVSCSKNGAKQTWKSPRLTQPTRQQCGEASMENQDVKLLGGLTFRRSPRLSSSSEKQTSEEARQKKIKLSGEASIENQDVKPLGGLTSRRSPRLSSSSEKQTSEVAQQKMTKLSGEASMENHDVKLSGGLTFRRSQRLSSSSEKQTSEEVARRKKIKLSGEAAMENHDAKLFGGLISRRSPRLSSSIEKQTPVVAQQKKKSLNAKCASIKASNSPNEQQSKDATNDNSMSWLSESAMLLPDDECELFALPELDENPQRKKFKTSASLEKKSENDCSIASFIGDPIPNDEALKLWGWRYELKDKTFRGKKTKINEDEEDETIINVERHYAQTRIGNCVYSLGDCAFIKGEGEKNYVGKIVEFFQTTDGKNYFRVQWFYRIEDTVVQDQGSFHDKRRVFYSTIMNDNLIDCIVAKVNVTYIKPRVGLRLTSILPSDFYYNMEYCVDYSTFRSISTDSDVKCGEVPSAVAHETHLKLTSTTNSSIASSESDKEELALLDIFSGCGGMSTGLCLGAKVSSVNLVTKWAVDSDGYACESLKLNHPGTLVRNESAEDFLELLKEWEKLCKRYKVNCAEKIRPNRSEENMQSEPQADDIAPDEFEVSKLVDICYGDPSETGKRGLYFKVRWKGYGPSEDTWEPREGLRHCQESIKDFVGKGMELKILPLPGAVDVICGGPPCQGISGYNRHRNVKSPLDDERNHQLVVFMDIVEFLKPKYVLMENVSDLLRFDKGSLGRYSLSRLVHMNYQARLGLVTAGCYGLPQFRLRVFLWGAHPSEVLPQFPLPTHEVIVKYWPPPEFERNTVALDEGQPRGLEKAIVIQDAISDLPAVTHRENNEEMSYQDPPATEFQRYIRSSKYEMTGSLSDNESEKTPLLYDHLCYYLDEDNYFRVCQIPKVKGANFRDLPGVVVGADNVARRDPTATPMLLPSGKPLVPDFCFTFDGGKSKRPFSRLWWDENVSTVLTQPNYRSTTILHPEQDRTLSLRECARLQGFPDYYKFCGTINRRYCQIGNAVAVPVGRALGFALGMAYRKLSGDEHLLTLPPKFSHSNYIQLKTSQQIQESGNTDDKNSS